MNYYKNDIRHCKGDTYSSAIVIEGLGQTVDSIYFTCRENLNDNAEILFQSGINDGISMIEYDEEKDIRKYAIRIAPSKTKDLQSGTYYYDLEVSVNSDVFTVMKGKFILEQDSTREDAEPEEQLIVLIRNSLNEINGEVISEDVLFDLDYVKETKSLLKEELNKLGSGIEDTDTFRSYANYVNAIYTKYPKVISEGTNISLNTNAGKMTLNLTPAEITQDETPTPENPVDVNVITGDNNIKIANNDDSESQNYPINVGSLEYRKMINYADQIFKNTSDSEFYDSTLLENEWYLKRNIGKVTFSGTENWGRNETKTSGKYRFQITYSSCIDTTPTSTVGNIFSNYFVNQSSSSTYGNKVGISYRNAGVSGFYVYDGVHSEIADFKNWLSAHNLTVYFVRKNSSYVHISQENYPVLREQLENIYNNAKSYDAQTNITQINDNLPFNIKVTALMKGDE